MIILHTHQIRLADRYAVGLGLKVIEPATQRSAAKVIAELSPIGKKVPLMQTRKPSEFCPTNRQRFG